MLMIFRGLFPLVRVSNVEIAGGAVQEDGFDNTLVQKKQEVRFD